MYAERESSVKLAVMELDKAIQGDNIQFVVSDAISNESQKYRKNNSTVANFIEDCCTERKNNNFNDGCTTKKLYDVYDAYCKDNNNGYTKTNTEFKEELIKLSEFDETTIIKRTNTNNFYVQYTITPAAYQAYRDIFGYNDYFHRITRD